MATPRILVVDNDPKSLDVVTDLLSGSGYAVTGVGDGAAALERVEQDHFDLVLAWGQIPPSDGPGLLEAVKTASPETLGIIVSPDGAPGFSEKGLDRGADDFLDPSTGPTELLFRISSLLEKRELREELRRARKVISLQGRALNTVHQGVALIDSRSSGHPVVFVNRGLTNMIGYGEDEIIGRSLRFLHGPETDPEMVGKIRKSIETGDEFSGEILHYKKDGSPFWILLTVTPLVEEGGDIRYWTASLVDLTLRKEIEASLVESEERFRQLTENIEDVFILSTPRMERVLYVSPSYENIFARASADLYRSPDSRLEAVHPNDRLKVIAIFGKSAEEKYEIEYRIQHPDGKVHWIRERGYPIFDREGRVFRIAGILSDITDEKTLRDEADQRLQQIIQADRLAALGEVVAGVAHEINNPNSFITYNIPLLEENWSIFQPIIEKYAAEHPERSSAHSSYAELMEDMAEIIDAIKVGSDRINRVVSNLRDFARLDESKLTRPVDIREVIEKTLTIVGAQLRRSAERIDLEIAEGLPAIQGHAQKLEQVVANLLVNASHAVKDLSGGRIRIGARYLERIDAVLVEIDDTGRGIPIDVLSRIFEPFFTTRRPTGGTGLGLSVSYGLVQEHRGRIGVISRPGAGSRFTVYLPVSKETQIDLHPTILCVDDDMSLLKMVRSMLIKVEDEFVETTARPEEVMRYLESHPEIDIVLSDVSMPKIDGWDLLARIRKKFPMISVVLYSGHPEALKPPPDVQDRPDAILEKPFEKFDLVQVLSTIGRQRL